MKLWLPNISEQKIGGGFTFMRNIKSGLSDRVQFVDRWQDADIVLISSVTIIDRNDFEEIVAARKKIVFRVDNIPRKSRNKRGRVYDNMRRFGECADVIVYQSFWAKDYAGYLIGDDINSMIIYNGVDQKIFYPPERDRDYTRYLFVQFNRDENKRFTEAAYFFHMKWRKDKRIKLTIVGQFSPEIIDADFDFFAGEQIGHIPPIDDPHVLADIYRDHDVLLFPAFCDAAPNTVLEARACGLMIDLVNREGGTNEMLKDDLDISLDRMCQEYYSLFTLLLEEEKQIEV